MAAIGLAWRGVVRRRHAVRITPEGVLLGAAALLIAYLVLVPVGFLVLSSFRRYELAGSIKLIFTLDNYRSAYLSPHLLSVLGNTFEYAVGGMLLAVALGAALAWIVERTNTPLRTLVTFGAAATYLLPGVLVTLAWVTLANPRIGSLNQIVRSFLPLPGTSGPFDVNSILGMVWVFGAHMYPIAYLIMSAAFASMDPALEEASELSGASILRTLRRVTLGVSRPAVLSAGLILFVRGVESLEVPLIIGVPANIPILTTEIYSDAQTVQPPEPGISAAFGILLLAVAVIGVYFYQRATNRARAFATITGKAYRPRRLDLGRWRWVAMAAVLLFLVVSFVLPILSIVWVSLFRFVTQPSIAALPGLTLTNYHYVLTYPAIVNAFQNSLVNSVLAASIVVVLTALVAWIVLRTRIPGRGALDWLAFAPIGIPATIIGISVLLTYLTLPFPLYGTLLIVTIAHVTIFLPYGMRLASDALLRVHPELEEAAYVSGASWASSYRRVLMPLLVPGFVAAWITIVGLSFRELSATIFLASADTRFISVVMYTTWADGNTTAAAAVGVVLLAVVLVLALGAWLIGRRFRIAE
ncbi:MAG: iron ABC transporter permease [Chloroflexota bacterium]|nr:iron ABC transporter permease [Chloroflexota bacterium]